MSLRNRGRVGGLAVVALMIGTPFASAAAQGAGADESAVRAAIDAANRRWQAAVIAGRPAGFAAEFALDATFAVPMAPVATGRAAIERSTRDWLAAVRVDSIALVRTDLRIVGHVAIEIGTVRTATTPRGGTSSTVDHAHFLTVWQRQPDGTWKITRDMTSPAPRPGPAPR